MMGRVIRRAAPDSAMSKMPFHIAHVYPICGGDGGGDGVRVRKIAFLENSRRVGNFPANPLIVR